MKQEWQPDHSTSKGYPFDEPITRIKFPHRVNIGQNKETTQTYIDVDPEHYPKFKGISWINKLFAGTVIDFLLHRLFDYGSALKEAEQQIDDMLIEHPFIPEDFKFKASVKPESIKDNPTTIYTSEIDESYSVFRGEGYTWHILKRTEGNEEGVNFVETRLYLPSHRIAYAAFIALGIPAEKKDERSSLQYIQELKGSKASLST